LATVSVPVSLRPKFKLTGDTSSAGAGLEQALIAATTITLKLQRHNRCRQLNHPIFKLVIVLFPFAVLLPFASADLITGVRA
jgi:hypothetical protein